MSSPLSNQSYSDMEIIPKCKDCGQPMFEIGEVGTWVDYGEEKTYEIAGTNQKYTRREGGRRLCKLYQCPEDKTVVIY